VEGTNLLPSTDVISVDLDSGTVTEDGPGTRERIKSSSSVDVVDGDAGNLYSGVVIWDGSGAAEGTVINSCAKESPPSADVGDNLINGTITDDGSGAADGAKSPSSAVAGNL